MKEGNLPMIKMSSALALRILLFVTSFLLLSCGKRTGSLEKELSDLKKRAYDINYMFVNEAAIVSSLAKKMKVDHDVPTKSSISLRSSLQSFSVFHPSPEAKSAGLPAKIDSVIYNNNDRLKFISRIIFSTGSDYYIYPKMNTKFQNLEESDFDYTASVTSDSLNSFVNPWRLNPIIHPLEKSIVISYVEYVNESENVFVAAHFSIQKVFEAFLENAEGSFMLIDLDGNILAMSDDAYYITGYRKPKHFYSVIGRVQGSSMIEIPTIYNIANESFRRNVFEMIQEGKTRMSFRYSDEDYTLIMSSIKQLKWQLIRIL